MTTRVHSCGRYRGFRYTYQPLGEVFVCETDHPRRWQWFAFEPDESDIFVVGVDTQRELFRLIDERLAKSMTPGASCRKCGRNIDRDDREVWDERCPSDPSGSHRE